MLKHSTNFQYKGLRLKSGHVYKFRYKFWQNDPEPLVVLLYKISGTHPKTEKRWNLIQAINFNYVPRPVRKNFATDWKQAFDKRKGNIILTWRDVKRKYPEVVNSDALRRYVLNPSYAITNLKIIPMDRMEEVLISTWAKDFSTKVRKAIAKKLWRK